jgi:hypothetical protein
LRQAVRHPLIGFVGSAFVKPSACGKTYQSGCGSARKSSLARSRSSRIAAQASAFSGMIRSPASVFVVLRPTVIVRSMKSTACQRSPRISQPRTVPTANPQGNITQSRLESLKRAVSGQSFSNFPAIFQGFAAKGIPESEIKPRENVFTFEAWKALGPVVRRGEHGVKVATMIETKSKEVDQDTGSGRLSVVRGLRPCSTFRRPIR